MANVTLTSHPLREIHNHGYVIELSLVEQSPWKSIEVKTVEQVQTALEEWKLEMQRTGKPWMLSAVMGRGERALRGFKKTDFKVYVNEHLVDKRTA